MRHLTPCAAKSFFILCLILLASCGGGSGNNGPDPIQPADQHASQLSSTLEELDLAPVPEGVDPAVFEELRRELSRVLQEHQLQRVASRAPQGDVNAVTDLLIMPITPEEAILEWSYLSVGDYDQNSEVNISDLTPLGVHFGKDDSDPDWELIAHVDGDGNGLITIADVTPIGQHFLETVDHYEIASVDPETLERTMIGMADFTVSEGTPRRFSVPLPEAGLGLPAAVRPADGNGDFGPWSTEPEPEPLDGLPGPADGMAIDHIPVIPFPQQEAADFWIVEEDFVLSHRLILTMPTDSASVAEFNAALAAVSASIIGADPDGDLLLLRIDADDFSDTVSAVESLQADPAVYEAIMEMGGGPDMLPLNAIDSPNLWTFEYSDYTSLPLAAANGWVKKIRAPQMWNLNEYVLRSQAGNPVSLGVIDSGFDTDHEDLAYVLTMDGSTNSDADRREHGTFCSGVMCANGGNGIGITGVNPWLSKLHARAHNLDLTDAATWGSSLNQINGLLSSQSRIRAINNSYSMSGFYARNPIVNPRTELFGDRNNDGDTSDPNEWPNSDIDGNMVPDTYAAIFNHWGRLYHNSVNATATAIGRSNFVIVGTTGNSGNAHRAQDVGPFGNAAMVFPAGHFLVTESTNGTSTISGFSTASGNVAAPGSCVRSTENEDSSNYDAGGCAPNIDTGANAAQLRYGTNSGTSFAAPQVTALAGVLWKLDPGLTFTQVKTLLTGNAYTVSTGNAPLIDCFSAAMGIDQLRTNTVLQKALMDIDDGTMDGNLRSEPFNGTPYTTVDTTDKRRGDGNIDMADFRTLRDAFLQNATGMHITGVHGIDINVDLDGPATHFKKDLNFDGIIGTAVVSPPHPVDIGTATQTTGAPTEEIFSRYDLNGNSRLRVWDETMPFKLDPDTLPGSSKAYSLLANTVARRDVDILLENGIWSGNNNGYMENAGNDISLEGSMDNNGSWLPRRFLLANRDGGIADPQGAVLKELPDYLHSFDFHLKIAWDSFDPEVDSVTVILETDMWPDGADNNGAGGIDEPFEQTFKRMATFSRAEGTEYKPVTLPLWTGAARLIWSANGSGSVCLLSSTEVYTGLQFGQDTAYTIPSDISGSTGWTATSIDAVSDTGYYTTSALVGSNPAIAYYDKTGQNIKYVRASDSTGSSWGVPVDAAGDAQTGYSVILKVLGGTPCISYSDSSFVDETLGTINAVNFVKAADGTGGSWGTPVYTDQITTSIVQMGWHNDLIELGGKPAQCFLGQDYESISSTATNFLSAKTASGDEWNDSVTAARDNTSPAGFWCSMQVVNGNPAIAFVNSRNFTLNYVRATSADGSTWGDKIELDGAQAMDYFTGPYPGKHASMQIVDGRPAIAFFGGHDLAEGSMLKYIRAEDANGDSWPAESQIINRGRVEIGEGAGLHCSMAIVGGVPAVSFYDFNTGNLLYLEAFDSEGIFWSIFPEQVDCVGNVGKWSSLVELANGQPGIAYQDVTNKGVKFAYRNAP